MTAFSRDVQDITRTKLDRLHPAYSENFNYVIMF
jgi:hypothetical protein